MRTSFKTSTLLSVLIGSLAITSLSAQANTPESYLTLDQAPKSLNFLPPPPTANSAGQIRDDAVFKEMQAQKGTARWAQAAVDADLTDDHLGLPFSETFGLEISEKNTPMLYQMMKKLRVDSNYAAKSAKEHYNRTRPFKHFNVGTCTPQDEAELQHNGSYPSGHTTIGWTYALLLAELRPERQEQILQRGFEYGQSRVVCNMHWQSDVEAGRLVASAQFARLQAEPKFQADFKKAQKEVMHLIKMQK